LMEGGWRPEGRKMATKDEGIKIATTEGRKQRMSIGSAGRARGATARGAWGEGGGRGEPYFRCDQRKTGS
jgi:hypothetical protein